MSTFDLTSPHFHADPFPMLDSMRATGTIVSARLPIVGQIRLAVTYDTCAELLKNHDHFARDGVEGKTRVRDHPAVLIEFIRLMAPVPHALPVSFAIT